MTHEEELQQLDREGIGEGDFDGELACQVPVEDVLAHEALEFEHAVREQEEQQ